MKIPTISAEPSPRQPQNRAQFSLPQLLLDAVFPPRCAAWNAKFATDSKEQRACEKWSRELFCAACRETLRPISAPFCERCGSPFRISEFEILNSNAKSETTKLDVSDLEKRNISKRAILHTDFAESNSIESDEKFDFVNSNPVKVETFETDVFQSAIPLANFDDLLPVSTPRICADCRKNRYRAAPSFDALRSIYRFEGAIRRAVHRLKYDGKTALAQPLAALFDEYLRESSTQFMAIGRVTHLHAVPLHARRVRQRGYNQSELLARELGKTTQIPVAHWLQRARFTTPQVELSRKGRAENVRGAFQIDEKDAAHIANSVVLLIDDVYTTGATLEECARVLKASGAAEVYGLTLAHQV